MSALTHGPKRGTYEATVQRLRRIGVTDPTQQIIELAEEIERYRDRVKYLEDELEKERHRYRGEPRPVLTAEDMAPIIEGIGRLASALAAEIPELVQIYKQREKEGSTDGTE